MKKNNRLNELLNKPISLSEKFYQKIKIKKLAPPLDPRYWPKSWKKIYFKGYSRLEEIILPKPSLSENISYKKILTKRQSKREFNKSKMSIKTLSNLLYFSAGLKRKNAAFGGNRFYPSAGARYPLETYILLLKPDQKLEKALYHYYLPSHSLEKLFPINRISLNQYINIQQIDSASCVILITAIFKRTTVKYNDRGYNYIMIEAGHLGQNIYLTSTALGLDCCAIGGFTEDKLNRLIDINDINESVIYALVLG